MQGATMLCGGDWRVLPFPDRPRCVPRVPLVSLEPGDIDRVEVVRPSVGARPAVQLTLRSDAAAYMRAALRAARSARFVLVHRGGALVLDAPVWDEVPGEAFLLDPGQRPDEPERTLRAVLGRSL
jgi:hypothetical protein